MESYRGARYNYNIPQEKTGKKKVTSSKIIAYFFIVLYCVGFCVGTVIVFKDTSQLYAYFTYIGAPVATVVAFIINKSKAENTKGGVVYDAAMAEIESRTGIARG